MADSDSDESFSGFSDIGSDIDVNLAGNFDEEISSVSSVSSDDIVGEPETAWTDALTGIPAREFNAAGAALGCTFVLPKETNELDFLKQFFPLQLILILVAETCSEGRSQKLDRSNHGGTVCVHFIKFMGLHVVFSVASYKQAWKTKWPFSFPAVHFTLVL